jgi:hypothetical protein
MRPKKAPYRQEVEKPTRDNWYPTVNGRVRVSLLELSNGHWRVCVWGGDDFGLERDYPSKAEAEPAFLHLVSLEHVDHRDCNALGFYRA